MNVQAAGPLRSSLKSKAGSVVACLAIVISAVAIEVGPAPALDVAVPRVESRAKESLHVQLDGKNTWTIVMQAVDDSQGRVLVAREEVGFVSFSYDLATKLFPSSFVNANLLVRRLMSDQEPAIKLLRAQLSPETQKELEKHPAEAYPSECLLNLLADDLNRVIEDDELLPVQVSLSASDITSKGLRNRKWLEAAIPNVIRSWSGDPKDPRRFIICNVLVIPDDDGQTSWVYFSSWQVGAPTILSYGTVFFGSMERLLKGKVCASGS